MVDKRHARAAIAVDRGLAWEERGASPLAGPTVGHSMLAVDCIEDAAAFARLRPEWDELLAASESDCPFLTWEWLYTWWRHLSGCRRLHLVTVRRGRRLLAIAPLAIRPGEPLRLLPFPVLEFLGSGVVGSDYLDLIIRRGEEKACLSALASHLSGSGLTLELSQLRAGSMRASGLARGLEDMGWRSVEEDAGVCPYVDLAGHGWDSYLATLSSAHRYNFRRRLRNIHKHFEVRFEQAGEETQRRELLRQLMALHRERWSRVDVSGAFNTPTLVAFHDEWSRLALQRGWLGLFLLSLDGRPAASLYGFRYKDVFYFYQSGFDPAFNRFSVGMLVLGLAIRSAIEEGMHECDLLHGDEEYKFKWSSGQRRLLRLSLCPPSARGALHRRALALRRNVKRLIQAGVPHGAVH